VIALKQKIKKRKKKKKILGGKTGGNIIIVIKLFSIKINYRPTLGDTFNNNILWYQTI